MDIVILKATNGDEIIAEVVENTEEKFILSKPRVVSVVQTERGPAASLIPWVLSAPDATVTIHNSIMAVTPAPADIAKSYLQTTTKIDLSGKLQ